MKYLQIFIILILISCEKNDKKVIVENFIDEFYIGNSYNINEIGKHMTNSFNNKYKELSDEHKIISDQYIKSIIDEIRSELSKDNFKYKISKINDSDITLNYKGVGEVFYLFSNDNRLLSFFIVENNKIYSFCGDLWLSKKNNYVPYFFFEN